MTLQDRGGQLIDCGGSLAADAGVCCDEGGSGCTDCPDATPYSVDVDFDGDLGQIGTCCSEMNGTFILEPDPFDSCRWFKTVLGPYYNEAGTTPEMCDTSQPLACYSQITSAFGTTTYEFRFIEEFTVSVNMNPGGFDVGISYSIRRVTIIDSGGTPLCTTSVPSGFNAGGGSYTERCPVASETIAVESSSTTIQEFLAGTCLGSSGSNGPNFEVTFV